MSGPLASLPPLPPEPTVSIVIPALNEERYIGALLESLAAQSYPRGAIEVLVADGGSTDRTREIVEMVGRETGLEVRLLENPGRTTAQGLNTGATAARGDVIIVLGAHSLVPPSFVQSNVEALNVSRAAAAGGPIETVGEGVVAASLAAAMSHPFGVGDARFRYSDTAGYVDTIAFAAYRRECFEVLSGFDTARDKAEDDDFNFRLRMAGGRLFLTPAVRSTYYSRATFDGLARQYWGYGRAKGLAFLADRRALGARHFVPAGVLAGGVLLAAASTITWKARLASAVLSAMYVGLGVYAARRAADRSGGAAWPVVLAAFPVIHLSYGAGMLRALLRR